MDKTRLSIISFTARGNTLSHTIAADLSKSDYDFETGIFTAKKDLENEYREKNMCKRSGYKSEYVEDLKKWTQQQFRQNNAILFIGACGIAVRTIADFIKDKLTDSPVLVMDERGRFIIPLLSGHMGGANELAYRMGVITDAIPVITTATDIEGEVSIDVFAKKHELSIKNREGIKKISSGVLEKKGLTLGVSREYASQVDIAISSGHDVTQDNDQHFESMLTLIPKEYIIGIGCRKNKQAKDLFDFVDRKLKASNIDWKQVLAVASIDLKKNEKAITELAGKKHIMLYYYSAGELEQIEGDFTASDFVHEKTGVDNVCERAAMAGCKGRGKLILKKQAENGMTLAIAKKEWRLTLYEE